jgi:hypothetical protein
MTPRVRRISSALGAGLPTPPTRPTEGLPSGLGSAWGFGVPFASICAMERYRFHADGALFYVTFSVVEWLPLFVSEAACKIITDSFNACYRNI